MNDDVIPTTRFQFRTIGYCLRSGSSGTTDPKLDIISLQDREDGTPTRLHCKAELGIKLNSFVD